MVTEPEIAGALQAEPDPHGAAERLMALANENGGVDNVTVIVVRFEWTTQEKGWFSWMRRGARKTAGSTSSEEIAWRNSP